MWNQQRLIQRGEVWPLEVALPGRKTRGRGAFFYRGLVSLFLFLGTPFLWADWTAQRILDTNTLWSLAFLEESRALATLFKEPALVLLDLEKGKTLKKIPLEIPLETRGQGGLFDIQLHPDFSTNAWVYISYARRDRGGSSLALARGRWEGGTLQDLETLYQTPPQGQAAHYGGALSFDGNGFLYLSAGERKNRREAQNPASPWGAILRLREDGGVPRDNPFGGEVYTLGHRNPQGLAFDTQRGLLWSNEHGPRGGDELNLIQKGRNYGWPLVSLGAEYSGNPSPWVAEKEGYENPLYSWTPSLAVSSLALYRGNRYGDLGDHLLVSSLAAQRLVALRIGPGGALEERVLLQKTIGRIRAVEVSPAGEVYLLADRDGGLYRLQPPSLSQ